MSSPDEGRVAAPPRGMGHVLTKSGFFVFSQCPRGLSSQAFANTIAPSLQENDRSFVLSTEQFKREHDCKFWDENEQ